MTVKTGKPMYRFAALVSLATFLAYLSSLRDDCVNWDDPDIVVVV